MSLLFCQLRVLFGSLIIKLSKLLLFYLYADQMKIQQRFDVFLQPKFTIFLLNILCIIFKCFFFNILKIFEWSKVHTKILYPTTCLNNNNLSGHFYHATAPSVWTISSFNLLKLCPMIFKLQSGVVPILSNKAWIHTGDQYLHKRLFKSEALKKVYGAASQSI